MRTLKVEALIMIAALFLSSILILIVGYRLYGKFLEHQFDIKKERETPACTNSDGVDCVPAKSPVLFGHHFSSIAGAGPIVGPIAAASAFGWFPAALWIVIGTIFVGGMHDFSALVTSIRHKATSIGGVCKLYLSPTTYKLFLGFVWLALVYVLIVFLDLTATTFAPNVSIIEDTQKAAALVARGNSVAAASVFYIILALLFGVFINKGKLNLKTGSFIFVPLVFIGLYLSQFVTFTSPDFIDSSPKTTWSIILLMYCFAASIMPVWMLLQPRDYLSSFLLFACVGLGGVGLLLSSATGSIEVQYPAFITFNDEGTLGYMFPALFIVIACGAVSGFHAIVASGTTAKQLPCETAAKPIAYGSMIMEATLGIITLATLMLLSERPLSAPTAVFSQGIGKFLSVFGIPASLGSSFGLLAISTFLLTTLDTCTRLARYIVEEFVGLKGTGWRYLSTLITLLIPLVIVFTKIPDADHPGGFIPVWQAVWPVFGATNQMLAALALLVVFVWRSHLGKPTIFISVPMVFMFAVTGTGLVQLISSAVDEGQRLIAVLSGALLLMALALVYDTGRNWHKITQAGKNEKSSAA